KTVSRIDSLVSLPIPLDTVNQKVVKKDSVVKDTTPSAPIIKGTVLYNLPYCGGARPTQEILDELAQMKPLTKSTLKLKNKSGEYFITTDSKGKFSIAIPPGKYDVYLTKKTDKNIYDVSPANCESCLTKPIAVFYTNNPLIQFTFRCGPNARLRP
ncbi:MAG TPA: hypothetical protein VFJ43_04860, partial [Bacteroidia bacterium]|nr:hypothetical protein [Bacteroidia bacterium]